MDLDLTREEEDYLTYVLQVVGPIIFEFLTFGELKNLWLCSKDTFQLVGKFDLVWYQYESFFDTLQNKFAPYSSKRDFSYPYPSPIITPSRCKEQHKCEYCIRGFVHNCNVTLTPSICKNQHKCEYCITGFVHNRNVTPICKEQHKCNYCITGFVHNCSVMDYMNLTLQNISMRFTHTVYIYKDGKVYDHEDYTMWCFNWNNFNNDKSFVSWDGFVSKM